jgi:hypothetical protein
MLVSNEGRIPLSDKAKILYSGFWDVPFVFVTWHKGRQFLFVRGEFDEAIDDYPDTYRVFALPGIPDEDALKTWKQIEIMATGFLGEIPVKEIEFDPMHRYWIDTKVIDTHFGIV